ncbi:GGDEF domain-containing protein [Maritalea sp.]|uniref:GGDEF domain-containing protein n=1 Tax=Maritalea sp. TaxID=2003361 RepID=UPI003EF2846C
MINLAAALFGIQPQERKYIRPAVKMAVPLVFICIIAVEILIVLVYGHLGFATLVSEWIISGSIALLVATPVSIYVCWQRVKLCDLSKKLALLASTDQLSGLLNRSAFFSAVENSLHTPMSGPTAGSLLYIDADNFKSLNDHFGHARGDYAIRLIASAITEQTPPNAIAGRIGGEEFAVFLPLTNKIVALSIAEKIRQKTSEVTFEDGSYSQRLSVSIGGALHQASQSLNEFVQVADGRMYMAKSNGRDQVNFDNPNPLEITQSATA